MREFGKSPDEWEKMPKEAKAEIMAFVHTENIIENYQMQELVSSRDVGE